MFGMALTGQSLTMQLMNGVFAHKGKRRPFRATIATIFSEYCYSAICKRRFSLV